MKVKFIVFVDNKNNGGASWIGLGYLFAMIKTEYECSISYYLFDEIKLAVDETLKSNPDYVAMPVLQHNYLVSIDVYKRQVLQAFPKFKGTHFTPSHFELYSVRIPQQRRNSRIRSGSTEKNHPI